MNGEIEIDIHIHIHIGVGIDIRFGGSIGFELDSASMMLRLGEPEVLSKGRMAAQGMKLGILLCVLMTWLQDRCMMTCPWRTR